MKNYLKFSVLTITLSLALLFSKQIQKKCIKEYNKSVVFFQKHTIKSIAPLGV